MREMSGSKRNGTLYGLMGGTIHRICIDRLIGRNRAGNVPSVFDISTGSKPDVFNKGFSGRRFCIKINMSNSEFFGPKQID